MVLQMCVCVFVDFLGGPVCDVGRERGGGAGEDLLLLLLLLCVFPEVYRKTLKNNYLLHYTQHSCLTCF